MIRKEIWHGMRAYKATFFIKGYRQRAVAGSHLQYRKLSAVFFNKKFNQRFGIAFSLKWGNCSDILNFKYSIPFVRYDTLAFHSVIIKNIHFTIIEITVNHIFLLIRQQEQIKILFFVFCNFYNSHQSHPQIPICQPAETTKRIAQRWVKSPHAVSLRKTRRMIFSPQSNRRCMAKNTVGVMSSSVSIRRFV